MKFLTEKRGKRRRRLPQKLETHATHNLGVYDMHLFKFHLFYGNLVYLDFVNIGLFFTL